MDLPRVGIDQERSSRMFLRAFDTSQLSRNIVTLMSTLCNMDISVCFPVSPSQTLGSYLVDCKHISVILIIDSKCSHFRICCPLLLQIFAKRPLLNTFTSSMVGGIVVTMCMTPFDVVMTRLYNQGNVCIFLEF
jgi:hypothetical protein